MARKLVASLKPGFCFEDCSLRPLGQRSRAASGSFGILVVYNFIRFCDERNPRGGTDIGLVGYNQKVRLAHAFSFVEKA